ncbi:hypothetical protein EDB19DRAFT_2043909 [Suillus lakei]|nr:hypothetical protein EDB19DRAFT_2043909 [Suillus lakei]
MSPAVDWEDEQASLTCLLVKHPLDPSESSSATYTSIRDSSRTNVPGTLSATHFVVLFQLSRILPGNCDESVKTATPNNHVLFHEMKHTHTASSSSFSSFKVFRFTLEITSGVHAPWIATELGQLVAEGVEAIGLFLTRSLILDEVEAFSVEKELPREGPGFRRYSR